MLGNLEILSRLMLAAVLSGLIGVERERLLWAAGLRTHMLVGVGACLIVIVSAFGFSDVLGAHNVVLDPSRIAAQVVSGVGFLGAGTILLRGEVVKGLTTAASLWAVAAIGLAVGSGLYVAGIATTIILLAILAGLKPLQDRYHNRLRVRPLRVLAEPGKVTFDTLQTIAGQRASRIRQFVVQRAADPGQDEILVSFARLSRQSVAEIAEGLRAHPGVASVENVEGHL
ncbi:putative Mg2+ transporter-C (MgtC) family protein [Methylobacterium brachiatum]|uniref:Protein MgtC n=1 Tax=Methylobacterium brachiatum TaxID=269660 RepID=A0AAJ1TUV0_9HYPH|nr:MgtC/SapB family protein [Methylobacterium brachiatum]MCB4804205.1 MgtC/SapB family protein [Methylobacterium brachiatum]MDQ0545214.1 putative Mg2+ transporter-C (MgtC) family protein [Methylobacterium brachiatum]